MDRYTVLLAGALVMVAACLFFLVREMLQLRRQGPPTLKRAIVIRTGGGGAFYVSLTYSGGFRRRVRIDQLLPGQQLDLKVELGAKDRRQVMHFQRTEDEQKAAAFLDALHDPKYIHTTDQEIGNNIPIDSIGTKTGSTVSVTNKDLREHFEETLPGPPDPPRPTKRHEVA